MPGMVTSWTSPGLLTLHGPQHQLAHWHMDLTHASSLVHVPPSHNPPQTTTLLIWTPQKQGRAQNHSTIMTLTHSHSMPGLSSRQQAKQQGSPSSISISPRVWATPQVLQGL